MFQNLKTDGLEQAKDTLGGGFVKESGIYLATIKQMIGGSSENGALNVMLLATLPDGSEYRETIYVSNRDGLPYYERDNKKIPLPGFTAIDDICMMTVGVPLSEVQWEEKTVKLYNRDAGAEVPTSANCIEGVTGEKVYLGIQKVLANKSKKNDLTNKYEDIAEERQYNAIDKVFHAESKQTMAEARNGQDATFFDAWDKKRTGQVKDERTIKDGVAASGATAGRPKPATPPAAGSGPAAASSKPMFGKR